MPNSALLRAYGHVDYLPLLNGEYGNPGDVVEVRADLVVSTVVEDHPDLTGENMDARIDWWLEVGGDEYVSNIFTFLFRLTNNCEFHSVFVLELDLEIPPTLTSFIRLIQLKPEWEKAQNKNKPPKPKMDSQTLSIIRNILAKRLAQYPTTLKVSLSSVHDTFPFSIAIPHQLIYQEDEALISASSSDPAITAPSLSLNRRHAIIVRMGEKRILNQLLEKTNAVLLSAAAQASTSRENGSDGKRKGPIPEKEGMSKKVKR